MKAIFYFVLLFAFFIRGNSASASATGYSVTASDESATCTLTLSHTPSTTICISNSILLYAGASGGTPPYTYQWSEGSSTPSIMVSPSVTTVYTVTVTDDSNCVVISQPITITVNPPLTVTLGPNDPVICAGETIFLSATGVGGGDGNYNYTWTPTLPNSPGPLPATPLATTTYVVIVTDGCGSLAAMDSVTVTVNPMPVALFNVTNPNGCTPLATCFNDGSIISSDSIVQWNWNFGDGSPPDTIQNPCHTYTIPGAYWVTLTVASNEGCSSSFALNNIIAHPVPVASFIAVPNYVLINQPVYFYDTGTGSAFWSWDFGDSFYQTVQNPYHVYASPGNYQVCLVVSNVYTCSDTICDTVHVVSGIETIDSENRFTLFPNPAADQFTIYDSRFTIEKIEIYNVTGQEVFSQQLTANSQKQIVINVSSFLQGIYFVSLTDEKQNAVIRKFVKM